VDETIPANTIVELWNIPYTTGHVVVTWINLPGTGGEGHLVVIVGKRENGDFIYVDHNYNPQVLKGSLKVFCLILTRMFRIIRMNYKKQITI